MLPVMIGALVGMLQGFAVLAYLYVGFPIAVLAAMGWTWLHVRNLVCEVHLKQDAVAFRTLFDAAYEPSPLHWRRVIDTTHKTDSTSVTLGLEEYSLNANQWPEWNELRSGLDTSMRSESPARGET